MFKNNKTPKTSKKNVPHALTSQDQIQRGIPVHGVPGVLLFVVCISMGYNVFLVVTGTDGLLNQIMAAPSVLFIGAFLLYKAWK